MRRPADTSAGARGWARAGARAREAALAALLAAGAAAHLVAPDPAAASARSRNEAGNALYREGKYAEARERYLAAQADKPDAPEIDFNIGDSFYQEGRFLDALTSFAKAHARFQEAKKRDPLRASAAGYNVGNALFKAGKIDDAIGAYKAALRENPADLDAKHNLEFALKKKEGEERKEEQEQKRDEKQDQKQERKQQKEQDEKDEKSEEDRSNEEEKSDKESKEEQGAQDQSANGDSVPPPPPRGDPKESEESPRQGMPREDALRILEALEAQELAQAREEEMNALLRALDSEGKDW